LEGSDILVATGRIPKNARNIGLDKTGVALDDCGYIQVNERLETTAPGIWALGERAGSPALSSRTYLEFRIVHRQSPRWLANHARKIDAVLSLHRS
jgi:pyruvate/2-oxoglutarate dehydrogenase complex dihydrolipoamide dehydrogenase (E3) component